MGGKERGKKPEKLLFLWSCRKYYSPPTPNPTRPGSIRKSILLVGSNKAEYQNQNKNQNQNLQRYNLLLVCSCLYGVQYKYILSGTQLDTRTSFGSAFATDKLFIHVCVEGSEKGYTPYKVQNCERMLFRKSDISSLPSPTP